ncbi:hypothetical protein NKH24_06800 [Mesorhizobium sp. M1300]|uniref:hypothetical protein n=1 Tax=Mesorhizobium sp. M1300 TaxID=2957077 RepID=UPI0033377C12
MERKRAPGGGRKPKGSYEGKSSAFSTRITPELRVLLDEEAERTGQSLSQIVERRLRESFDQPKRMQKALGPTHVRALAYMLARVIASLESATGKQWNRDAFTFLAAQNALRTAMDEFAPKGDPVTPDVLVQRAQKIEENAPPDNKAMGSYMTQPQALGIIHALTFRDMMVRSVHPTHDIYDREEKFSDEDESLLPFIVRNLRPEDAK